MSALLDIEGLTVEFASRRGTVQAVRGVSFALARGRIMGLVGESGSGKSVSSYATLRILDRAGRVTAGRIAFSGIDLLSLPESAMADLRGREIAMVFQNPRASLNPIRRVGQQIADVLIRHNQATHANARAKAIDLLRLVRINDPEQRVDAYPFEMSGGQCQRVVIAIALACAPRLLIADEPTTGLDATTQKAVMDLLVDLARARDMATVLITHDLGLASAYCDDLVIMQQGQVVEQGEAAAIFANPRHPYTRRLLRATPRPGATLPDLLPEDSQNPGPGQEIPPPWVRERMRVGSNHTGEKAADHTPGQSPGGATHPPLTPPFQGGGSMGGSAPLLEVRGLTMQFPGGVTALHGIGFTLGAGESLGLVGESGSGKSTTSAIVMRLLDATAGRVILDGRDIAAIPARRFARDPDRAKLQLVFQDATESLNPRHTAAQSIMAPLCLLGGRTTVAARAEADLLADQVGLPRDLLDRFPHQLSGGQKARVGIARAIALRPRLLILDEPTAALDVSVQAVVLNLLAELRARLGMAVLFVSHDLHVVRLMCERVIVLKSGHIVEEGATEAVMTRPQHPYTRALLDALPHPPQ